MVDSAGNMKYAAATLIMLSIAAVGSAQPIFAQPIDYSCPRTYAGDGGRLLDLVERTSGAWRVDDAVPFVDSLGRFWRLVCSYRDPATPGAPELEAAVYWVDLPHEDGRVILEDACEDGPAPEGIVRSRSRQAKALAALPADGANQRLAREMLAAAEAVAAPCPGTPGAPRICSVWRVTELYAGENQRVCTWRQGSETPDPNDAFRYVYRSECQFRSFTTIGSVKRVADGQFERSYLNPYGRRTRVVYRGDFEGRGVVRGEFSWISAEGDRSPNLPFEGRCLDGEE